MPRKLRPRRWEKTNNNLDRAEHGENAIFHGDRNSRRGKRDEPLEHSIVDAITNILHYVGSLRRFNRNEIDGMLRLAFNHFEAEADNEDHEE